MTEVREDLAALPGASGSMDRHAEEYPLLHCGHLRSLRWVRVMVTADFDEGRIGGFERQDAPLYQIYGMLEAAAKDSCPDCPTPTPTGCPPKLQHSSHGTRTQRRSRQQGNDTGNWPLLGVSLRAAQPDVLAVRQAIHVTQQGQGSTIDKARGGGANSGRVVIFMLGSSRNIEGDGPCFSISVLFCQRNRVHEICQLKIATARPRHAFWRRRIPMPASPRHRARCNRHEARAGIVALISCCLVRLSTGGLGPPDEIVSLPACTRRRIRRGAALLSRLGPLSFSSDKQGRWKALFFAVLNGTAVSEPEPVKFSCDPENWAHGQATSESTAKDIISARISFLARAEIVPLLD